MCRQDGFTRKPPEEFNKHFPPCPRSAWKHLELQVSTYHRHQPPTTRSIRSLLLYLMNQSASELLHPVLLSVKAETKASILPCSSVRKAPLFKPHLQLIINSSSLKDRSQDGLTDSQTQGVFSSVFSVLSPSPVYAVFIVKVSSACFDTASQVLTELQNHSKPLRRGLLNLTDHGEKGKSVPEEKRFWVRGSYNHLQKTTLTLIFPIALVYKRTLTVTSPTLLPALSCPAKKP